MKIRLLVDVTDAWGDIYYYKGEIVDAIVEVSEYNGNRTNVYCVGKCFYLWEFDIEKIKI